MSNLSNFDLSRVRFDQVIRKWLHLSDAAIQERLSSPDQAETKEDIKAIAQTDIALQRSDQLEMIAATAWPSPLKHLITFSVGIFGALVIGSSAMGLVSSTGRGPIAAAGGAIAGGASAILCDVYITRYLMQRRMRYNILQAIAQVKAELAELPNPTTLERYYYQCQAQLLQQVESQYWAKEPKSEEYMAMAAISAEGIIALIVALPAGLSLAVASAAIPILINFLIAKVQSDRFEIPETCEGLIPMYEEHIPAETISAEDALAIIRLDASLQYVSTSRPPQQLCSIEQAKGLAQLHFAQARIADLEEQGMEAVADRNQQFQSELESLSGRCPEADVNVQGLSKPQADEMKKQWKANWMATETERLEAARHNDLELLHSQFGQAIAFWKQLEAQGLDEYWGGEPLQDVAEGDRPQAA